jgi:hypothetical protein
MEIIKMAKNNDENDVASFLTELKDMTPERPARQLVNYESYKPEYDAVHKGYVLEGYTEGIESPLGSVSTAVRMVAPGNDNEPAAGRRITLWLSSYEQNDFQRFLTQQVDAEEGRSLPVTIDFLRRLETSQKTGRDYKQFFAIFRGDADRDALPDVHEDQLKTDTPATE